MCSHSHTCICPSLGAYFLLPLKNAQMVSETHRQGHTQGHTQILIHRHVCTYMCQSWETYRPLIQTGSKSTQTWHRPRLADTPTPTNTETGSDTQTCTHKNIQMCMCPWGHIQAQNTLKKCPNTHTHGRTALNSTVGGCAGRGEKKRSLP